VAQKGQLLKITHEGDGQLARWRSVRCGRSIGRRKMGRGSRASSPSHPDIPRERAIPILYSRTEARKRTISFILIPGHYLSGLGYVVMQPQYRGSTGYGSDFLNATYQHFGDRAYSDVDSATDYAIAQGWPTPSGWRSSAGAPGLHDLMDSHPDEPLSAAIEGAGITDWLSFIPTSDVQQIDYDQRWQETDAGPF